MGAPIRAAVRKAARFAVYEEIRINVKKYQIEARTRVEIAL